MELNQLNIYAKDFHRADLVLTYTLNDDDEIEMFKIWVSDKEKDNIEIINYANLLLYEIIINNDDKPTLKDIYRGYQRLFAFKQWKPYDEIKTFVNIKSTLTKAPYSKYVEITKEYINNKITETYNKYIKKGE